MAVVKRRQCKRNSTLPEQQADGMVRTERIKENVGCLYKQQKTTKRLSRSRSCRTERYNFSSELSETLKSNFSLQLLLNVLPFSVFAALSDLWNYYLFFTRVVIIFSKNNNIREELGHQKISRTEDIKHAYQSDKFLLDRYNGYSVFPLSIACNSDNQPNYRLIFKPEQVLEKEHSIIP